jgi:hypothetical protein
VGDRHLDALVVEVAYAVASWSLKPGEATSGITGLIIREPNVQQPQSFG